MRIVSRAMLALLLAVGFVGAAQASIVINGTRVIYPASEREVTVRLTNESDTPRLVQSWVDTGNPKDMPDGAKVPFSLTPPMTRIEPNKSQVLRLMYTGEALPQDKESVFWLNVLEIPPRPQNLGEHANYMQFAVRTRIKIFFRPKGLSGTGPVIAADQLRWRIVQRQGSSMLEASNPTPYNVSFSGVGLKGVMKPEAYTGGMVTAGGTQVFPLSGVSGAIAGAKVAFTVITDFGGFVEKEAVLSP